MYEIKDKVFLITGAASGIGAGVVISLLEEGAKNVVILDLMVAEGKQLEKTLNSKYGSNKVKFFNCDVTQENQVDDVFDKTIKEFGYIDVVINNAAIMNDSEASFRKEIEINVLALVSISLKAYKLMQLDQGGRGGTIVNISSIVALNQLIPCPVYSATKSAVLQFSLCLGRDENYNRSGVRVITICFGATDTALLDMKRLGFIDDTFKQDFIDLMSILPVQNKDDAISGVIDALKRAEKGAVWLVTDGNPPEDYTATIKNGYDVFYSYSQRSSE